ncbi:MAG TPA: IS1 family transposase [Bryobacteraceae bacterium]|nr:IS1 family transposase [Bryobacteraceae bacterium]
METLDKTITSLHCPNCGNASKRFGKHRNGLQRFRCLSCRKTFTEDHQRSFRVEDYLNDPRGQMAIRMLVEGCSIRSVERLTGIRAASLCELLVVAGERCERRMNAIRNVRAKDIQGDEIWGYVGKKERNKQPGEYEDDSLGDAWTWVAIERYSKLVVAFTVGRRSVDKAFELMFKVRRATSPESRFQLTTDGLKAYVPAVDEMLADRCDYAQLIKFYSQPQTNEQRYSPAEIVEVVPVVVTGNPDPAKICTSHVERQNLTMRMQIRRLTRLTNAFSKKFDNHRAAIALHFAYYNWCRIHGSLRVTPAMESGITDSVWTLAELLS